MGILWITWMSLKLGVGLYLGLVYILGFAAWLCVIVKPEDEMERGLRWIGLVAYGLPALYSVVFKTDMWGLSLVAKVFEWIMRF